MKKKNININLLPIILILPVLILALFNLSINKGYINEVKKLSLFSENVEEEVDEGYTYQEAKFGAVSLKVRGTYDDNIKASPITCKQCINRMIRLIYMDGEEELGFKYVYYHKPAGELMVPKKTGYDFVQWTNKDGELVDANTIINSKVDYKIYANWNIRVSQLIVNPNGGTWRDSTGTSEFSMEYLEQMDIEDPTRVGYTFNHWDLKGSYSKFENKVFTMGEEDSTLTAMWDANPYTLTIDPNGGTFEGKTTQTKKTVKFDSVTPIEVPTREGYTFTGWTIPHGEMNNNNFTLNYPGDVTLTANWVINNYEYIVYHSQQSVDGKSYNKVANDTVTGNAPYHTTLNPKVNTYTGFTSPAQGSLKIEVDTKPPKKNILEYKYTRNSYVLTINPNTGTWKGTSSNSTVNLNYQQTYSVDIPVKKGYSFKNWTKSTNDSSLNDKIFTMGATNTTLTANWQAKEYTLTYNVNGGNAISPTSKKIVFDQKYGTLPTPQRRGYTFDGWYTLASGGTKVTENTVHTVDNNVTIYAHWKNTPPTVPTFSISYVNSGRTDEGLLQNGNETINITVKSTDKEDGTPTIDLKCISGALCSSLAISRTSNANGQATFTIKATKMGVAVLQATATDYPRLTSSSKEIVAIYGPDGSISKTAYYTNTTFDSGWLEPLEGCYISDFKFTVKFASGHSNSSSYDPDEMTVYGMTESGREVTLYTWSGNMLSTLHTSTVSGLDDQNDRIVKIRFHTYSPHDDCARDAVITYSAKYKFDKKFIQ